MISPDGLEFIKQAEGCKLVAYPDPGTGNVPWTIGVGHTKGVKQGDTCTQAQADQWLADDLQGTYDCIQKHVTVPLSQGQFDALCSFIFNLGCGGFRGSTLLAMLNKGDYDGAAKQFPRWVRAGGNVMAGLTKRRAGEAEMFSETEA